jgi:hypothetical protein
MAPQNQEISRLQNLINTYQRDKLFLELHYERKRQNITNQMLALSRQPQPTGEETRKLILELGYLNEEKRREIDKLNAKIEEAKNQISL